MHSSTTQIVKCADLYLVVAADRVSVQVLQFATQHVSRCAAELSVIVVGVASRPVIPPPGPPRDLPLHLTQPA